MANSEAHRVIWHHKKDAETVVYWLSRHKLLPTQRKTLRVLHGKKCKIVVYDKRFEEEYQFIMYFLSLCQKQNTAGIYFVSPPGWKTTLLDKYLKKINGTPFGWFIGFGKNDPYNSTKQELFYRNKYTWHSFPIEMNFGKTEVDQCEVKKYFHRKK